jgi:hypothetical protein
MTWHPKRLESWLLFLFHLLHESKRHLTFRAGLSGSRDENSVTGSAEMLTFLVRFIFFTWYILWTFLYRFWKWITLFIEEKAWKKFSLVCGELVIMPDFSVSKRSTRRGSEWEILEGLKDGQRFDKKPDVYSGYLHKKRKWPLKGWHKVS